MAELLLVARFQMCNQWPIRQPELTPSADPSNSLLQNPNHLQTLQELSQATEIIMSTVVSDMLQK
jgi:hypothetical protein